MFHSLIVLSREPETICRLSAEKETERISFVCPTNLRVVTPLDNSHNRSVLSHDEESAYAPSDEITYMYDIRRLRVHSELKTKRRPKHTQSETM